MTVLEWGKGRPDYYVPTAPVRPDILTESDIQTRWFENETYDVPSLSSFTSLFYTIPADVHLALGAIDVTCSESCINELRLLDSNNNLLSDIHFDMRGSMVLTDLAGQTLNADETLNVYIYNNNVVYDTFSVTMSGILEKGRE